MPLNKETKPTKPLIFISHAFNRYVTRHQLLCYKSLIFILNAIDIYLTRH